MTEDKKTRIRKGLDFMERFVGRDGKINVTKLREYVESLEDELHATRPQTSTDDGLSETDKR